MRTAIVGGGAAGFFLAINLKEMMPEMEVTIFERSSRLLAKVEISGGGRCNCTNSFASIRDLSAVYPRGHRLMKRLFKTFNYQDAYTWFEQHGIELVTQDDECVFPASQDAHTIINCFLHEAHRHGVIIKTQHPIQQLDELVDYDYIAVTTGGSPRLVGLDWLSEKGIVMEPPVPSLFTFRIDDKRLQELMGTVVDEAIAYIPGTKFKATGPLLITHWGMSGPAILKLSSYAARELNGQHYQMPLAINWTCRNEAEVEEELHRMILMHPQKQLATIRPFNLPSRLWSYLLEKVVGHQAQERWQHLGKKDFHRLVNVLINDTYAIAGRAAFKDEFVTCGGVSLTAVNFSTLSSKLIPNLYFAGEVLDIDGITGGFNFQAAWTTAYTVAKSIYNDAITR